VWLSAAINERLTKFLPVGRVTSLTKWAEMYLQALRDYTNCQKGCAKDFPKFQGLIWNNKKLLDTSCFQKHQKINMRSSVLLPASKSTKK
jgi:hypothetical protein